MSDATLRRAAALMRERAEAIPAGPWEKEFSDVIRTDVPFGADGYLIAESETVERAAHIASWHPAVALAVADWLEVVAGTWGHRGHRDWHAPEKAALAVASAYLGDLRSSPVQQPSTAPQVRARESEGGA